MELLKLACVMVIFCLNFSILCTAVDSAAFNLPFHKRINPPLLKPVLNVQSDDKIPEYEVVQLRFLSKISADDQEVIRIHLSAFGKDIHLHLQRNDDFNDKLNTMSVFEATLTENGRIQLNEVIFKDDDPGTPYIDPVHLAAVTLRHGPDGKLQMEGVIGDDLFIEPAPADIYFHSDYFTYNWESTDESNRRNHSSEKHMESTFFEYPSSSTSKSGVHIVRKSLTKTKMTHKGSIALDDLLDTINDSPKDGNHHKRPTPPLHVWVEVLLMVDFDTYTMHISHGYNETQIRRYYVSFLNGVDLRFKTISNPQISLVLSQIVIFKSRDATPFLQKNQLPNGNNVFNGNKAIRDLASHLYAAKLKQGVYLEFDVAVLLTNLNMCSEDIIFCNRRAMGLAYFKGACSVKDELWTGAAIVEDNGGYDGILTAAHEIGHLLGVDHDGSHRLLSDPRNFSFCSPEDGYLMSNVAPSGRIFQWSECSIKQFRYFLNSGMVSCLLNEPNYHNELVESELPGVVMSLDEQCKRAWGTQACAWDAQVCVRLRCYIPKSLVFKFCWSRFSPAAEGSYCGEDMHCRHGKCVSNSLIYSPAWNMVPFHDDWIHESLEGLSTTLEPPPDEDCVEYSIEFCETYFLNVAIEEACKNSRIIEECCHSQKFYCKV